MATFYGDPMEHGFVVHKPNSKDELMRLYKAGFYIGYSPYSPDLKREWISSGSWAFRSPLKRYLVLYVAERCNYFKSLLDVTTWEPVEDI